MFSQFIIKFCHSMNLNSASFEFHRHRMNSKSKCFRFFLDFVKKVRMNHNINIKRSPWFRVYS